MATNLGQLHVNEVRDFQFWSGGWACPGEYIQESATNIQTFRLLRWHRIGAVGASPTADVKADPGALVILLRYHIFALFPFLAVPGTF
jgi:hypothetical protein